MADKKISALPAATTPLSGAEVLPVVQGGTTDQVSVSNLTAGRDVAVKKLNATDNVVIGTAGKGIDFSANTHAAGMTSELLNDYEEGTFTPSITGGATNITYVARVGSYTKVGRLVTFSLNIVVSAASSAAANFKVGGLPFTAGGFGSGSFAYDNGTFVNSTTTNMPMIFVTSGTTEMSFFQGNGTQVLGTNINAIGSMNFYIYGSYIV